MQEEIEKLHKEGSEIYRENKKFLRRLSEKQPKNLDATTRDLDTKVFKKIDCLECGNCCKTTPPIITKKDTERIAKHLKMKPRAFEEKYVAVEDNGEGFFKTTPCEFLADDNYCLIYDVRPKACSEYPHTSRKKFHSIPDIHLANTTICPATAQVIEKLKELVESQTKKGKHQR